MPSFLQASTLTKIGCPRKARSPCLILIYPSLTPKSVDDLRVQNQASSFLSHAVTQWINAAANLTRHVFDEDQDLLYNCIVNGKAWNPSPSVGPTDIANELRQVLFAMVAPYAWTLGLANTYGIFIA
jgi:hypothetical protein